jgi:hypothetical protein
MAHAFPAPYAFSRLRLALFIALGLGGLALALIALAQLSAQVEGDRGIAPIASSGDIDIGGIKVDVTGKNAHEARENGWRLAQRKGWEKLGGPKISDSQLEALVSAIVVEREQIGGRRYVATLGVIFDRTRAGQMLGAGGARAHSAPMLLIPVLDQGGARTVYEMRNPWQQAWAEYQTGASMIDYVRPSGAGGDSLLVTYGQTGRRSRTWWRNILDQFGAADVLIAIAKLERPWPGGPVEGRFTARYGPDDRFLSSFTMRAADEAGVPAMLEQAREKFDTIYSKALSDGLLRPDPTLALDRMEIDPAIKAMLEAARRADAAEDPGKPAIDSSAGGVAPPQASSQAAVSYSVQFATPDAAAVDAGISSVRGAAGVQGAATTSIALGGTSVMQVSYAGSLDGLAAALRAKGWQVVQGGSALRISR